MKPLTCAAPLCLALATGLAAGPLDGTQNHPVQALFLTKPCAEVIDTIDNPAPNMEGIGQMAMAFGFLMGIEAQNPGIRGSSETILTRLRTDCAQSPDKTAMELLDALVPQN